MGSPKRKIKKQTEDLIIGILSIILFIEFFAFSTKSNLRKVREFIL